MPQRILKVLSLQCYEIKRIWFPIFIDPNNLLTTRLCDRLRVKPYPNQVFHFHRRWAVFAQFLICLFNIFPSITHNVQICYITCKFLSTLRAFAVSLRFPATLLMSPSFPELTQVKKYKKTRGISVLLHETMIIILVTIILYIQPGLGEFTCLFEFIFLFKAQIVNHWTYCYYF